MSVATKHLSMKSNQESSDLPTFSTSYHGTSEHHSLSSKDTNTSRGLTRDESSGLICSLMNVAHNAANMIKPKQITPASSLHESLEPKESRKGQAQPTGSAPYSSRNSDISLNDTPSVSQPGTPGSASLSTSNVHFEPVHSSPIHTLGEGDLSLIHFEKKHPVNKRVSDSAEVSVKGGPFMTESNNNKLFVSGGPDSKIVRRKSISNGSIADSISSDDTIDTDGAESHIFDPSEFSNLELDQILESPNKAHSHPKKDKEFHNTFKQVPANEHLLADFSCALSRDILVQGKMYLSPHYICFNSNILGWVTNLVVPIQEIIQIEKKSTAVLFPNGMVIRTLHQKYVFATFLSRDATFNMITQVWHSALQDNSADGLTKSRKGSHKRKSLSRRNTSEDSGNITDTESDSMEGSSDDEGKVSHSSEGHDLTFISRNSEKAKIKDSRKRVNSMNTSESGVDSQSGSESVEESQSEQPSSNGKTDSKSFKGFPNPGPQAHAPTSFEHEKSENEVEILEHSFNAPLGVVYNLLYGPDNSSFIRVLEDGKNFDISKEKLTELNPQHKEREYSYTKPLSGPIGPKQTKCNITETLRHYDLSNYCELEQVTKTPDVPSGNSFKIKTLFFFSWGPKNTTKLIVYTCVEWSAKSWIKSAVEKGSMDGQKTSMKVLTDSVSDIISNGGSGAAKKKRRKTRSESQSTTPKVSDSSQKKPEQQSFGDQVVGLLDHIGQSIPVSLPMISSTVTGAIVVFVLSSVYTYILAKLIGSGEGGTSMDGLRMSGNGGYMWVPSSEVYLRDERFRRQNEAQLWDWIASRTGEASPQAKSEKRVGEQYADENFKEMMRMTKSRLEAAYLGLM